MNTQFLLLAEFETGTAPLEDVAKKYFNHDRKKMLHTAMKRGYPFPIFRIGGQKSNWVVSIVDLATHLDSKRDEATEEYRLMNPKGPRG